MTDPRKRPLNVDLQCNLRVIGWGKESFIVETDEGDGYDFMPGYMEGEGPVIKSYHYDEWAEQLENIADWCRRKSKEITHS
jgi:hypothetical protein